MTEFSQELYDKSIREQKEKLQVVMSSDPTYIVVLAICKDKSKNVIKQISCKNGVPLGGYLFDKETDSYYYECCDYFPLGTVPVGSMLRIKDYNFWTIRVPLAENVVRKFLDDTQKKDLKVFRNQFKIDQYDLQFVQMIAG